jgi:hypothetical protein
VLSVLLLPTAVSSLLLIGPFSTPLTLLAAMPRRIAYAQLTPFLRSNPTNHSHPHTHTPTAHTVSLAYHTHGNKTTTHDDKE